MSRVHFFTSQSKILFVAVMLLSMLLVAYSPMASYSGAQSVEAAKLQELKQKAIKEIDRRIANLQSTLKKLEVDVHLDNKSASATANGNSASVSANEDGVSANVEVKPDTKKKVEDTVKQFIDKLTAMKEKIQNVTTLQEMQSLAKGVDSQYQLDQMANVQGAVTKAVEGLTGVFDKLKTTISDLQSQVTKLKDCAKDANGSGCANLGDVSEGVASSAQSQLDSTSSMMSSIGSILLSVVTMLLSLVTSFSGLLGGLGSLSSLGDVSNLSSLSSLTGLFSSFSAISSQLDIGSGMGGSVSNILSSVSELTGGFNF